MPLRGSYTAISRQLDELERRASRLTDPGCLTCWGWPEVAVTYAPEVAQFHAPNPPWDDGGDPLPEWPDELRCGACGREPSTVIKIVYEARDPGDLPIHVRGGEPPVPWRETS
jgi:hypothetical protein